MPGPSHLSVQSRLPLFSGIPSQVRRLVQQALSLGSFFASFGATPVCIHIHSSWAKVYHDSWASKASSRLPSFRRDAASMDVSSNTWHVVDPPSFPQKTPHPYSKTFSPSCKSSLYLIHQSDGNLYSAEPHAHSCSKHLI